MTEWIYAATDLVTENKCTPFRMRLWSLHFDLLVKAPWEGGVKKGVGGAVGPPPKKAKEKTLPLGLSELYILCVALMS